MKFNFKLMNRFDATGRGLMMELVPGLPEDSSAKQRSIFISEAAFGFIEPCITACWPKYRDFGHWGTSRIPAAVWLRINERLTDLESSLHTLLDPDSVVGVGFIFAEVRELFSKEYSSIRPELIQMIYELKEWIDKAVVGKEYITIVGV